MGLLKQRYYFEPYVGKNYSLGLDRHHCKILVLGPHIPCLNSNCRWREFCCTNEDDEKFSMDKVHSCEKYRQSLRDAVKNEVDNYINGKAYTDPLFSEFTGYILGPSVPIDRNKRKSVWDNVMFTTFIQHFTTSIDLSEDIDFSKYIDAFIDVLNNYQPQMIYVWSKPLCDYLISICSKIEGLRLLEIEDGYLFRNFYVMRFAYNYDDIFQGEPTFNSSNYNREFEHISAIIAKSNHSNADEGDKVKQINYFLEGKPYKDFEENHLSRKNRYIFEWISTCCVDLGIFQIVEDKGRLKVKDSKLAAIIIGILKHDGYRPEELGDLFTSRTNTANSGYEGRKLNNIISNSNPKRGKQPQRDDIRRIKECAVRDNIIEEGDYNSIIRKLNWSFDEK